MATLLNYDGRKTWLHVRIRGEIGHMIAKICAAKFYKN
jgi:hypothetical protein